MDSPISSRIIKAFEKIRQDPKEGKPLQGPYSGLRSYRVGDCRIVYRVDLAERLIVIYRVGHRSDVYRH